MTIQPRLIVTGDTSAGKSTVLADRPADPITVRAWVHLFDGYQYFLITG